MSFQQIINAVDGKVFVNGVEVTNRDNVSGTKQRTTITGINKCDDCVIKHSSHTTYTACCEETTIEGSTHDKFIGCNQLCVTDGKHLKFDSCTSCEIEGTHLKFTNCDSCEIVGNHIKGSGDDCTLDGSHITWKGDNCTTKGNFIKVTGRDWKHTEKAAAAARSTTTTGGGNISVVSGNRSTIVHDGAGNVSMTMGGAGGNVPPRNHYNDYVNAARGIKMIKNSDGTTSVCVVSDSDPRGYTIVQKIGAPRKKSSSTTSVDTNSGGVKKKRRGNKNVNV
jgi:hypothetical protein